MASGPQTELQRRKIYRTVLAGALIDIKVGGVERCALMDANSDGFSFATDDRFFSIGDVARVEITFRKRLIRGSARIVHCTPCENGRFRYGAKVEPVEANESLRRVLHGLSMEEQRRQLRAEAERRG
jgi:hypothetical protein